MKPWRSWPNGGSNRYRSAPPAMTAKHFTCAWKAAKARCSRRTGGWVAKHSTTGSGATCANNGCHFFAGAAPLWRLSVPNACGELDLPGQQLIDWGGAQRWLTTGAPVQAIRDQVAKVGGHATCYAPGAASSPPLSAALMRYHRALKQQLDPQGVFNPGRLYPDL